jgi:PAS domain S-box-containing protein
MLKDVLKILFVEDSERDSALLTRHLESSGYNLDSVRVETEEDFLRELRARDWDIILSDYSLPTFDALSALFLVKTSERDIPFIIISGTIGEEVAVEAMRLGASDYFMKDNLARLVPAIERELEELEGRREKRELEKAKGQSLRELAEAQRLTHIGSWTWDLQTDTLTWSAELFRIFGLEPAAQAPSYAEIKEKYIHPEDADFVETELQKAFAAGATFDFTYRLHRPDGTLRYLHALGRGVTDDQGKSILYFGTAQDVTERKHWEEKQRMLLATIENQTDRLRNVIDNVPGVVWESSLTSAGGRSVDFVSDYIETLLGYSVEEWTSTPNFGRKIIHDEDRERVEQDLSNLIANGEAAISLEFRWIAKDGSVKWVQTKAAAVKDDAGSVVGFRGVTIDITDRKTAEFAVRESEERYRLLFANNPIPMWVYDLETLAFLEVNNAAVTHYGYSRSEFLSMRITDIRDPNQAETLEQNIASIDGPISAPKVWKHKKSDGVEISVEITAHSLDFNGRRSRLVLAHDVSDRQMLEQQLRHSQKMEAIGVLAGGIAHDFNNLLTVINGYADLMMLTAPEREGQFWSNLQDIREAGERAAGLTRQLLAFSRKQVLAPKVLDLNAVVADLEKMLRRIIGENIDFRTIGDEDLLHISADPGQIEQIVMNLVVNAKDAMPSGGKLTIESHNVELTETYAQSHISVSPGKYVMLAISDTGIGMTEETQRRIFEPFFSTKEVGHGTGLGLSMVYGIVKQSGGNIWVYSEPGQGTTFKIYLPVVTSELSAPVEVVERPNLNGNETVLLVEDEDMVRKLTKNVLELFGYRVLEAAGGKEALEICNGAQCQIDLLLTDVVMPGMSGRELAVKIAECCPKVRILYMSGYTDNAIVHQGIIDEGAHFVQKPFQTDVLLRKVREVLDSSTDQN